MKSLVKNLAMAALIGGLTIASAPSKVYSQINKPQEPSIFSALKEQKPLSNLNFYFETEGYGNLDYSGSKKHVMAWLSSKSNTKEDKLGHIWFYYGDTNDDDVYDYVKIEKNSSPIRSQEKFYFNFDTKKIDYVLNIYEFCSGTLADCDKIISKSYNNITQEEAKQLGADFLERIKEFSSVQKEFSRFNSEQLEELVRKEYSHKLKMADGRLAGNSRIAIEKFLSEEEIKKVENYPKEKKERIEKEKLEQERWEKIRKEQEEAKKPKVRLKMGGGIVLNTKSSHIGSYLGITPQLTNKKGKGFAAGLDIFVMNSKIDFERSGGREDNKETIKWSKGTPIESLISETLYTNSISAKNTNRFGLNLGYVSPSFEIFTSAGFLRQKSIITTTAVTEEYIEDHGVKQGESSFKTEKTIWGSKELPFYFGFGIEIFPSFKKNNHKKNFSFSIDALIAGSGGEIYSSYSPEDVSLPMQAIIKAGLKYTFGK